MAKKYALLLLYFSVVSVQQSISQELRIKKGVVVDSIAVNDTINETFALYLPKTFEMKKKWPVLFVFDMNGRGRQVLGMFKEAADEYGYILAAPNNVRDSISLSTNMVSVKSVIERIVQLLPVHRSRMYTAGRRGGGRFANLVPVFFKDIDGAIAIDASIANAELLNNKNLFHFIAITSTGDFNYTTLREDEQWLNRLKFPNALIVHEGENEWPAPDYLKQAFWYFDLAAMAKGNITKDSVLVLEKYNKEIRKLKKLQTANKYLLVENGINEALMAYRTLINIDSLKTAHKRLKKEKLYRSLKRSLNAALFKENLLREDYAYYLEEDVMTYNFKNLGWWNYQMDQIKSYIYGDSKVEQQMGKRLLGYLNALVEDNMELVKESKQVDEDALTFLLMLKTITEPEKHDNFLEVVSISAKNEDYGTALFYLEELLKKGYKDREKLYKIPHTTLFRITPEFNALVKKYFEDARYEIKDE